MDPRFKCAFCSKEVRRLTDKSSVGMDGSIYFKSTDETIDIALEFCSLKCLVSYIVEVRNRRAG